MSPLLNCLNAYSASKTKETFCAMAFKKLLWLSHNKSVIPPAIFTFLHSKAILNYKCITCSLALVLSTMLCSFSETSHHFHFIISSPLARLILRNSSFFLNLVFSVLLSYPLPRGVSHFCHHRI